MIKHGVTGCWPVIFVLWTQFFSRPHLNETHRYHASFSAQSFQTGTTFIVPALTTDPRDLSYQTTSTPPRSYPIIGGQLKPYPLTTRSHVYSTTPIPHSSQIEQPPRIAPLIPLSEFLGYPKDRKTFRTTQNPQDKANTTDEFISLYFSLTMIFPIPVSSHVTIQARIHQLSLITASKTWPSPRPTSEKTPSQTVFGIRPDYTSPFWTRPASLIPKLAHPRQLPSPEQSLRPNGLEQNFACLEQPSRPHAFDHHEGTFSFLRTFDIHSDSPSRARNSLPTSVEPETKPAAILAANQIIDTSLPHDWLELIPPFSPQRTSSSTTHCNMDVSEQTPATQETTLNPPTEMTEANQTPSKISPS